MPVDVSRVSSVCLQDREQMTAGIYSTKWFLQCFIDRVRSRFTSCPPPPQVKPGVRQNQTVAVST